MRDRKADNLVRKQLWLEQCAWANRRTMTPSELRLWAALSARKLGVQFRREVPLLGLFIVDFCAPSVRLVVEVDCGRHTVRRAADARRDAALCLAGYRVVRIHAGLDALACQCGGHLNFISPILDDEPASAILDSLHLSSEAPPIVRARSPDGADPIPFDE